MSFLDIAFDGMSYCPSAVTHFVTSRPPGGASPSPVSSVSSPRRRWPGRGQLRAQDAALPELLSRLEPLHPRNTTFPGEVFLRLAADALACSGVSPADPLPLEAMRDRFLPECSGAGPAPAQVPVRRAGGRDRAWRHRAGPARRSRLVASR